MLRLLLSRLKRRMIATACCLGLATALTAAHLLAEPAEAPVRAPQSTDVPRYTDDGQLRRPENFEEWVFVGASLGLSYSEHAAEYGDELFHNVYLTPRAYQEYKRSGTFPEKTMLAMVVYRGSKKASSPPKLQGLFADELVSLEVAVKDRERFDEGWAYFDFGAPPHQSAAKAFPAENCFQCHAAHADDDNVFVQFYPVLRQAKKDLGERQLEEQRQEDRTKVNRR